MVGGLLFFGRIAMQEIEQPGAFYLGRAHDLSTGETLLESILYDSKDLTTHAVCVGMTGSGKTGLCLSLLEEAALDGIPAIAIDPKGDLGNLLLAFPNLAAEDFRPWIDESEASRTGISPDKFAAAQAQLWRDGLAKWDQTPERIQNYVDRVERVIYTPGSSAGIPLTVLKSFNAPPPELLADTDLFRDRVASTASGLLALVGINVDPVRSREHIFLSNVLESAWRAGRDLDLGQLIREIQKPPFERVGIMDIESFYPASDRNELAMTLNNLLASPSFASWMEGAALNVGELLHSKTGKPRLSIISIAHLDDAQRMFFVTILLGEIIAWMRSQPGTNNLRAILYMDEVFGYFPPVGNPPAKRPMLTLLKQARAYGLGCVLATQNPVDLDYKGLSNAGTWFLGRLQTERDKARVLDGLESASAEVNSRFNRRQMETTLAALGKRVFLLHNVNDTQPKIFQTRWAMSYLRGPLTREQIRRLMDPVRDQFVPQSGGGATPPRPAVAASTEAVWDNAPPLLPPGIHAVYLEASDGRAADTPLVYRPGIAGTGNVRFFKDQYDLDEHRPFTLVREIGAELPLNPWKDAAECDARRLHKEKPVAPAKYAMPPSALLQPKTHSLLERELADELYETATLAMWNCDAMDTFSQAGESREEFSDRMRLSARKRLESELEKIEVPYRRQRRGLWWRSVFWGVVGFVPMLLRLVLSAIFKTGRGPGGISKTAIGDLERAARGGRRRSSTSYYGRELQKLDDEYETERRKLTQRYDSDRLAISELTIRPRKSDIEVDRVALAWLPYRIDSAGVLIRAF
jgi:hypothetical protein